LKKIKKLEYELERANIKVESSSSSSDDDAKDKAKDLKKKLKNLEEEHEKCDLTIKELKQTLRAL
jgi:hypothetical protein